MDQAVIAVQGVNNPATGRVTFFGTGTVGQTVNATVSGLVDEDGLEAVTYTYQWVRVEEGTESDIADATGAGYTMTAADAGKRLKLKASFTDFLNNAEMVTSAPWPAAEPVAWTQNAACAMPAELVNGTRDFIWTAELGVGSRDFGGVTIYGYNNARTGAFDALGSLSDATFTLAENAYAIDNVQVWTGTPPIMVFTVESSLPTTRTTSLKLHVCGESFDFSSASYEVSTQGYAYTFTEPGLDWSSVATRRVYLSVPDATPPVLSAMEVNVATLTMIYDEPLKTTAPTRSGGGNPTIVVKRSGKTGAITVSNVRAGTGTNKNEVTMTLNPALEHGDRIEVTYDRTNTVTASRIQDLSGNKAVALRSDSSVVNTTPSGPSVTGIAFAGAETVYAIGDAIAVDVTFNERVRVTGEPTIMLGVGSTPRTARWKMGQAPGTVQRFEYTVAEGEIDADGAEVVEDTLVAATGSTVRTAPGNEAVVLGHEGVAGGPGRTVDGVRPSPLRADAAGPTLTITWDETLDASAVPTPGRFSVSAGTTGARTVREITIEGRNTILTLARGIAATTANVTVAYDPPAVNGLRDAAGNTAAAVSAQEVTVTRTDNNLASGLVTISGTATVGETVRASVSGLTDPDGLHAPTTYAYQWVRVDGATETDISGGTGASYILTGADAGKKLRVKASFTDFLDNPETLTSDPWPALEPVAWGTDAACASPAELLNGTREQIWTAELGVGSQTTGGDTIAYGYGGAISGGSLSDKTFELGGSTYTIELVGLTALTGAMNVMQLKVASALPTTTTSAVKLHICGDTFEFSSATYNTTSFTYQWSATGLDWSMVATRRMYLSKADTTVPVLERVTVNASTVTLTYDERLKVTSPAPSEDLDPIQFKPVGEDNSTVSNIRAGVGPGARNVTFSIAPPGRYGQTFAMLYRSGKTTAATRIQDPAGNDAAAFTTSPVTIENTTPEGPSVEAIAFAGDEEPYGIGATIAIDVTFNESVRVTSGRPTLALEVGENTRSAVWKSGQSAGATHRFEYTVVEDELDIDGPEVPTNGLEAAGATIRTTTGNKAVALGHGAVAGGANRAVDAVRPTMASAEVAGPTLTVTWDETLDEASVPENAGGFRVKIGSANGPAVNAIASVSGSIVTLTLASAVADGTMNVTLEYRAPRSGAKIQDATGNDAANATGADAVSVMVRPDTKKPEIARAEIDATMLTVTFDEALDESAVPTSPGGFTVAVTRAGSAVPGHTISALSVAGTSVTLTVAPGVATGDAVTLTYVKPATNPLRDLATTPNEIDPFDTVAVENRTGALMVTLSKTEVVEGDDAQVVFNIAREAGTSATTARVITITPDAAASAAETADWTIADTELTIAAGETEASTDVTIVDDAVLEGAETVTFTISVDGIEAGSTTIEIADDDRAVLSVQSASETVTEGTSFAVTLRLDPHQDNAPDAVLESLGANGCFLDFAVDAELAITGDDATPGATHTFAATGLDSCTRSIDVTVPTLAADSQWRIARPLTLTLSPASGADARVETGSAKTVTVQDNTPQPGPVVMEISASPVPSGASSVGTSPVTKNAFFRLPANAVHRRGTLITFTVRFDIAVMVTGSPQLKLDLHGIEHRAPFYNGSGTNELKFRWRVGEGDNDADGIAVQGIALNAGTIRDAQARDTIAETFPAQTLTEHRVRGGLYAMWLDVEPQRRAIEGEEFEIRVERKGSFDEWAVMVIEVTDNAVGTTSNPNTRWNTDPSEGRKRSYPVWFAAGHPNATGVRMAGRTITPKAANQTPNGPRLLTVRIVEVDATHLSNTTPDCQVGRPGCPDTPPKPFDTTQIQWHEKGDPASFTVRVDPPGRQARIGPRIIEFPSVTAPGEETGYVADERIEARVEFEAPVTVDTTRGTPTLGLALGGVRRETTYESGSGSTVLVFARTASAADAGEEAAKAIANGLMENGARIRGENGRPANLEFGIAPGVAEVTIAPTPGDDGAWTQGEAIDVNVRFEEPVNVDTAEGTPSIEVMTSSGAVRQATWVRGSLTDTLRFSYTLAPEDGASTSILVAPDALALNDGAIYSTGGLHVTLDHNGVGRTADNGFIEPTVPTVSVADAQASEGETLNFAVTLSTAHSAAVTVDYATSDGSASAGSDYTHESGTLLFAPGETAKTVAVAVLTDTDSEGTETVTLTLSNATGATIATSAATGRVTDVSTVTRFTAAFGSFPPEHDGSTKFTLHLRFSEEPAEMSYKTVRDTLFNVTGGEVKKARRLNAPSNQGFEITIKPAGNGAATLELATGLPACGASGSVCAPDGRRLEGPLTVTVPGPVAISVADAEVDEEPGAKLAFVVTLDRARHAAVTVDYATSDGTAVAGEDYTAESGTLSFAAGETAKTVEVAVLDDSHDEGSETMMFTLSNASGARIADGLAIGTINNSDVMPRAWLLRFGRTVGSQVVDALTQRLDGAGGSHVIVGGINVIGEGGAEPEVEEEDLFGLPEWATSAGREADAQTITGEDIRLRSAFHLSSGAQEPGAGPAFTAWGRVAVGGFEAVEDDVTMDGTVTTGFVGFDAEWERLLAGVMISQSEGEGSYRQLDPELGDDAGTVESSLTGVYPYARVDLNANVSAWALAGAGSGELTLHQEGGGRMGTDISMRMGALGVKGRVLDGSGPSGVGLNVKSDAMWVGTKSENTDELAPTRGAVTRLRLILQGDRTFEAGNGSTFTPSAEIGLRHDGGDAETGTGVEVGAGLRYTVGAVTIEAQARTLIAHEASGYKEWGASGAIRVTPSPTGRGLTLSIAPAWGQTGSAAERLWSAHDARAFGSDQDFEASSRLELDAGYGFGLPGNRGVLTPYAGLALGEAGDRTVRAGTRWQFGPDVVVGLEATRQTSDAGEGANEGANEVRLRAALRF